MGVLLLSAFILQILLSDALITPPRGQPGGGPNPGPGGGPTFGGPGGQPPVGGPQGGPPQGGPGGGPPQGGPGGQPPQGGPGGQPPQGGPGGQPPQGGPGGQPPQGGPGGRPVGGGGPGGRPIGGPGGRPVGGPNGGPQGGPTWGQPTRPGTGAQPPPAEEELDFGPCLSHFTGIRGLPLNPLPRDCRQALKIGGGVDGVYVIFPAKVGECRPLMVYCDQGADGGGWTVIQRRMDGRLDFFRDWAEYKEGFGSLHGEHWLGLDNIHALTMGDEYHLFVKLYRPSDMQQGKAEYFRFFVGSEETNYTMAVSRFDTSGNAGDSLEVHNGMPFSTWDRDNDNWGGNCALDYKSGWWFSACHKANLNGPYLRGASTAYAQGVIWQTYTGYRTSLIYSEMKIKPRFL